MPCTASRARSVVVCARIFSPRVDKSARCNQHGLVDRLGHRTRSAHGLFSCFPVPAAGGGCLRAALGPMARPAIRSKEAVGGAVRSGHWGLDKERLPRGAARHGANQQQTRDRRSDWQPRLKQLASDRSSPGPVLVGRPESPASEQGSVFDLMMRDAGWCRVRARARTEQADQGRTNKS